MAAHRTRVILTSHNRHAIDGLRQNDLAGFAVRVDLATMRQPYYTPVEPRELKLCPHLVRNDTRKRYRRSDTPRRVRGSAPSRHSLGGHEAHRSMPGDMWPPEGYEHVASGPQTGALVKK